MVPIISPVFNFLFFIPQFGNSIGRGEFRGKAVPTYVYPQCLKDAIRDVIDGNLRDYPDPEGAAVSIVIYVFY